MVVNCSGTEPLASTTVTNTVVQKVSVTEEVLLEV